MKRSIHSLSSQFHFQQSSNDSNQNSVNNDNTQQQESHTLLNSENPQNHIVNPQMDRSVNNNNTYTLPPSPTRTTRIPNFQPMSFSNSTEQQEPSGQCKSSRILFFFFFLKKTTTAFPPPGSYSNSLISNSTSCFTGRYPVF